jgi:4-diphosphocytidyl-2-C-methyl-D-erythritol kinase
MASPLIVSLKKQKNFYGSKVKVLSPAKINLYLNVKGKYPNGFHRLESVVERVSLCDEISIRISKSPVIKLSSNVKSLENADNLVFKAARLIQQKIKITLGLDIFLKKNIPVGAGLGGGSSNAASTLLGLDELFGLKLGREALYSLGSKLGSDVNFFLSQSRFAFLAGKGQVVSPFKVRSNFRHLIIWPGAPVSTKRVYLGLRVHPVRSIKSPKKQNKTSNRVELTKFFGNVKILRYALQKKDVFLIKKSIFNALEKTAFSLYGRVQRAKELLERKGIFTRLSGSGSALYTVGNSISLARVKSLAPKKWAIFEVNTF